MAGGSDAGDTSGEGRLLLGTLTVLTVVSGLVDAVSYLGLGHVFTANMTGNVVVLGFAAAGAAGFSVAATLTSLACFLAGALCGGWLARRISARRRLLGAAMAGEVVMTAAAAVIGCLAVTVSQGWPRFTVIAVLAVGMGVRNATVRRLSIPDVTTTVLTMTLTGLAADSSLVGGENPRAGRRAAAVVAMLVGAYVGGLLFLHHGAGPPLVAAVAAVAVTGVAVHAGARVRPED